MDLKKVFLFGTIGFIVVCLGLFYHLTTSLTTLSKAMTDQVRVDYSQVEDKIRTLEEAVLSHRKSMKEIENLVIKKSNEKPNADYQIMNDEDERQASRPERKTKDKDIGVVRPPDLGQFRDDSALKCSAAVGIGIQNKADINMLNVYDILKFDNPDGGAWKQGWEISINQSRFSNKNKLRVFVVPHSHNDPGWIKTFEKYFTDQTKHILDNMLEKMAQNSKLKFIWAEISYFSLWWEGLEDNDRQRVKKLVEDKQLEFVTGGWVMPDESSSHYFSLLTQLIEGHQWLFNHLNYVPRNGWSIDPFGMSPTIAYIIRRSGLRNMVIQRTHYSVKKYLAQRQQLEFRWEQSWDNQGSTDILCHMMPFYSYDVPHTCGPDPKVCCQFDFKRMRGISQLNCPWGVPPVPVIMRNVKERSLTLLEQYRKKAMLYKTNTLLVPLGDDFRWENYKEWDAQSQNYLKIMDYINSQPELSAEVTFGTLQDYFAAINEEIATGGFKPPVLSGDFFTYADREDNYWSGYFTSRPFHKAADRVLIAHQRSAHIAFTLMTSEVFHRSKIGKQILESKFYRDLLGKLIKSRRNLSLFQHHDGIAGTSKDHVMADYGNKLLNSINDCTNVMQHSLNVLTHLKDPNFELSSLDSESSFYEPVTIRETFEMLPHFNRIILDHKMFQRFVTVFNSVARARTQIVRLYVSTYRVKVEDLDGHSIECEIFPIFQGRTTITISKNIFELSFLAEVKPLSVRSFFVKFDRTAKPKKPEILLINPTSATISLTSEEFPMKSLGTNEESEITNGYLTVQFDSNGLAKSVQVNGIPFVMNIAMFKYGAREARETSGLYLFLPDGPAQRLPVEKPFVKILKGKFQSYVEVSLPQVKHRMTLYNHDGYEKYSIEVKNLVDIRSEQNFELMMRIETEIQSENEFFTDLNGFQMIRRKKFDFEKIPIQGNYYPFPTSAFIEDSNLRLTVLTAQPLGAASLSSGQIEIMMDRRLMQDDNRGAGQGDTDNLETMNIFKLVLEVPQCQDKDRTATSPMLSLSSQISLEDLLHSYQTFTGPLIESQETSLGTLSDYNLLSSNTKLPCDIQLIDTYPLPSYKVPMDDNSYFPTPQSALIVRRVGYDGQLTGATPLSECLSEESQLGWFNVKDLFGDLVDPKVQQMTLNFITEGKVLNSSESVLMKPMEIYGFLVQYSQLQNNIVPEEPLPFENDV